MQLNRRLQEVIERGKVDDRADDSGVNLTVIIPTYNRSVLVQRALRSVLAQTLQPQEILVIDDGSTDGTGDALKAAFPDCPALRYVWQANGGVSSARNHALRLARGRCIALLDSDDEWFPEKLQRQWQWLQDRPDFGMVLCNVVNVSPHDGSQSIDSRRYQLPQDGEALKWILREPALTPSTVMLRREVVERIGGFDETLRTAEDLDYHLRIARHFKIGLIDEALTWSKEQPDSLSRLERTTSDHLRVVRRHVQATAGLLSQADRDYALLRAYRRNALSNVYAMRWSQAAHHLLDALRVAPSWRARAELWAVVRAAVMRALAAVKAMLLKRAPLRGHRA